MEYTKKTMEVNLEQQKLISSPLRVKIIYLLAMKAMTAKQVADELGKSAGSIHYHIQQLYNGGILELEETKENRGIIEKYYRSKATHFNLKNEGAVPNSESVISQGTYVSLTEEDKKELQADIDLLFLKYVKKSAGKSEKDKISYEINFSLKKEKEEER
ncbi:ArsR/SmtB family transcription factor [Mesobacillus selenatarsenatis]|uniref:Conserved domain protein n=1 Tax=Mesobacillus selenatarsenatis (strain DSM 18680 / JCM 14380 / FERM P-15431 / SF-1) TaxID=1321606 RepID=A0A0A8X4A9_MESS1|nr:winged helix-turn-helix domain-containing protein [Mesobacillus selenatarsenatis]GAM14109.1 conserved domain protein [Mesobacillus selenatarsenatis SF-1]